LFLVFGFPWASFQTWRDEHAARAALQSSQRWERSPEVVRRLQQMYAEVSDFNRRAFAVMNGSEDDFLKLKTEVHDWSAKNGQWILNNMGNAAYYRIIKNSGPLPDPTASGTQERQRLSLVLQIMERNIGALVESSAWDKR
jgi:hypothetical protein